MTDNGSPEEHPAIAPLSFLLGRWEGAGVGGYPTIESFKFGQEIVFSHIGKPYLIYNSRSWRLDDDGNMVEPLAGETGFWRPQPDGKVEVLLAHPTGITEIYARRGPQPDQDRDGHRRGGPHRDREAVHRGQAALRPGQDRTTDLAYAYDMAAMGQPLSPHLWAQLKWDWIE